MARSKVFPLAEEIAADPKISKLFGRLAGDWRAEVEKTAKAIEAGKKLKPVKADAISLKTLKTIVGGNRGREPGSVYPMERGSNDVHVNLPIPLDPVDAVAMVRYPTVVSLRLYVSKKSDEAGNLIPFRIFLQRWSDRLSRLEFDVAPKTWNSDFLNHFVSELGRIPKLEVFKSVRSDVSDDVITAVANAQKLREIRISCEGNAPTATALDVLNGSTSLKVLWLRGARISTKEAAAFAKANPKMYVDINTF